MQLPAILRIAGSRNNVLFNWRDIDNTALSLGLPEPIDERNIPAGHYQPDADRRVPGRLPATQRHGVSGYRKPFEGPSTDADHD